MKEDKNKVGRPKLADTSLKKNSIIMVEICLIGIISLIFGGLINLNIVNYNKLKGDTVSIYGVDPSFSITGIRAECKDINNTLKLSYITKCKLYIKPGSNTYKHEIYENHSPIVEPKSNNLTKKCGSILNNYNTKEKRDICSNMFTYYLNENKSDKYRYSSVTIVSYKNRNDFKNGIYSYARKYEIKYMPSNKYKEATIKLVGEWYDTDSKINNTTSSPIKIASVKNNKIYLKWNKPNDKLYKIKVTDENGYSVKNVTFKSSDRKSKGNYEISGLDFNTKYKIVAEFYYGNKFELEAKTKK